jgi:hypothetical protein
MGYLGQVETLTPDHLRRAMVYGSALGSFAVERFSVSRLVDLPLEEIVARVEDFRALTAFETHVGA